MTDQEKSSARYQKGLAVFREHLGEHTDQYIERLEKIYPKFSRVNVEFAFGDLYGDPQLLDERTREIATIAALTVQGSALPQ
jgi:4-carboxymuconolactone decarboxylase